jgi:two-component system phosphate regulon sensor histidine kinase PhoR
MKKKAIILILVLASVSLLGIVLTQLYWVTKTMDLKEEQFDNSVRIAMKSVINQMMNNKNYTIFKQYLFELSCQKPKLEVTDVIPPTLLDSLIKRELMQMSIDEKYYYGIYNNSNKRFVAGHFEEKQEALLNSHFQFSVKNIYHPGDYKLCIYFPAKQSILLRQMEIWLLMSVFFLIVLIISYVYVIFSIIRQKFYAPYS